MKLAELGTTTEPRGLTASQSMPADIFTTAAVPGRTAALDVCVASSTAPAARGDAEQAAFDRKRTHHRNEIGELRHQNTHYRPLVWTADGRPHPAVTRTLQCAADIASSRNGQHQSAKSLHRRWKHEIQIALLQRRAAMARALLQNPLRGPSGSSQAFLTEPCITGVMSQPLTEGLGRTTLTSTVPTWTQHFLTTMTTSSPSRTVLRITGSQGNSCSTRSPQRPLFGSGVGRCSSLSRPISCSAGVRVSVFSVTLRRHRKPSSSLCSCWTCRTGDGPPERLRGLGVR